MGGCKGPITTFIVEPFVPYNEEFYLNIVSERLGCSLSFSECGGIEIEENWDKVCEVCLCCELYKWCKIFGLYTLILKFIAQY